jgi:hypothetical protein
MANISFNVEPGKKYKIVIDAVTMDGKKVVGRAIDFDSPKAPPLAKNFSLKLQRIVPDRKVGTVVQKWVRLSIPENVIKNIIWTDTVRDVVHVVFRESLDANQFNNEYSYLLPAEDVSWTADADISVKLSRPKRMKFTSSAWNNGHPRIFNKRVFPARKYAFHFVIARYVKVGNDWSGFWLGNPDNTIDLLSEQVSWT